MPVEESTDKRFTTLVTIKVIDNRTGEIIEYTGIANKCCISKSPYSNVGTRFVSDGIITSSKAINIYKDSLDRFDFIEDES